MELVTYGGFSVIIAVLKLMKPTWKAMFFNKKYIKRHQKNLHSNSMTPWYAGFLKLGCPKSPGCFICKIRHVIASIALQGAVTAVGRRWDIALELLEQMVPGHNGNPWETEVGTIKHGDLWWFNTEKLWWARLQLHWEFARIKHGKMARHGDFNVNSGDLNLKHIGM